MLLSRKHHGTFSQMIYPWGSHSTYTGFKSTPLTWGIMSRGLVDLLSKEVTQPIAILFTGLLRLCLLAVYEELLLLYGCVKLSKGVYHKEDTEVLPQAVPIFLLHSLIITPFQQHSLPLC